MQASMAAAAGKPMLSDEEYDDLKAQLRNKNSRVVQQASLTLCTCNTRTACTVTVHQPPVNRILIFTPKGRDLTCICAVNPECNKS